MNERKGTEAFRRHAFLHTSRRVLSVVVILVAALFTSTVYAQLYTSNIVGTVTDATGAVVPGAKVELLNVGTGVKQDTQTNQAGDYVFQYLHPGTYTLTAEAKGFKKFVQENILIQTLSKVSVNVALEPGPVTQAVTVTAAPPMLQTQTGEQSTTLETTQMMDLPLARSSRGAGAVQGWSVLDSSKLLSPGIVADNSNVWTVSSGGYVRKDQDYIDGAMASLTVWQGNAVDPAPDAVQEVKVMTNAFSAVYGNTGGSIALETTKSGTNKFRGDAYEYLMNTKLNAGNTLTHIVTPIHYNQPGFTIGGPVKKDKLFFFFDAEWTRNQTGFPYTGLTVPDTSWTQGNFSNVLGTTVLGADILGRPVYSGEIFNYYTQRTLTAGQLDTVTGLTATSAGTVRDPFPGNAIPMGATTLCAPRATCVSPAALKLQALYPAPSSTALYNNFNAVPVAYVHFHEWDLKMDFYARPQDKITGRWSSSSAVGCCGIGPDPFPGLGGGGFGPSTETSQQPVLDWVHTFSSSVINDVHASYFHNYELRLPVGYGKVSLNTYGITGLPQGNLLLGPPYIGFTGTSGTRYLGDEFDTMMLQGQAVIIGNDLFSVVHGRHTIQTGGEIQRVQTNNLQPNPQNTRWYFNNDFSDQYSGTGVGNTGFDYASFLLGLPQNLTFRYFPSFADVRTSIFGLFVQDDFRVKPHLTLNLGLRWDAPLFYDGVNGTPGTIYTWNGTTASLQYLGQGGFRNTQWNNNYKNFAPRIGFAWSPSRLPNTVIRGGYGLFTIGVQGTGAQGTFPLSPFWAQTDVGRYTDSYTSALTPASLTTGGPTLTLDSIPYTPATPAVNANPGIVPDRNKMSTAQQWNLAIQHQIPGQILLNLAYAGTHSVHLPFGGFSYNVIPPNLLATCQNQKVVGTTNCVPYTAYNIGALGWSIWLGSNIYHSMQLTATKHLSYGLSFLMGYTWAKNIDLGQYGYREPVANRMLDRADDPQSVRHRFTFSYDYYLPAGPGRHWLTHGPLVPFLGGWQVTGITSFQTGFPLSASTGFACQCGGGASRPNQIGPAVPSGFVQNNAHWFNAANFTNEALYSLGTSADVNFFGPRMSNFDVGLAKRFYFPKLGEQRNLQFRTDFFNAFNTPWWGNPNANIQSSAVGQITSVRSNPRNIQMALKFFF